MAAEHDIYRSLRLNRIIVLTTLVVSTLISLGALVFAYSTYKYHMNHALVLSANGEIMPLKWVERKEVADIQLKDHLTKWFDSYYTFDQSNMITQREKGLWLISGEEGKKLEEFYESKGWYNDIIRKSLGQKSNIIDGSIETSGYDSPYNFKCTVAITVYPLTRQDLADTYHMTVLGQLSFVEPNWPLNIHGLLIHNYRESPWIKIEKP